MDLPALALPRGEVRAPTHTWLRHSRPTLGIDCKSMYFVASNTSRPLRPKSIHNTTSHTHPVPTSLDDICGHASASSVSPHCDTPKLPVRNVVPMFSSLQGLRPVARSRCLFASLMLLLSALSVMHHLDVIARTVRAHTKRESDCSTSQLIAQILLTYMDSQSYCTYM